MTAVRALILDNNSHFFQATRDGFVIAFLQLKSHRVKVNVEKRVVVASTCGNVNRLLHRPAMNRQSTGSQIISGTPNGFICATCGTGVYPCCTPTAVPKRRYDWRKSGLWCRKRPGISVPFIARVPTCHCSHNASSA